MKFAVIVASRGRPQQAATVIGAAQMLASGRHEIDYLLAVDDDDGQQVTYRTKAPHGTKVLSAPRPTGVGQCWNRCVSQTDADAILALTDDGLLCTLDWDALAVDYFDSLKHMELGILALNDTANPGQATIIMAHRKWIDLQPDGDFFDPRFPFWFSDTALAEVYAMTTGYNMPLHEGIVVMNRPGRFNPRIRDMDLWWDLHAARRRERIETAARIRERLNLPNVHVDSLVAQFKERDERGRPASHDIVATIERPAPVSAEYVQACEQARQYLGIV